MNFFFKGVGRLLSSFSLDWIKVGPKGEVGPWAGRPWLWYVTAEGQLHIHGYSEAAV